MPVAHERLGLFPRACLHSLVIWLKLVLEDVIALPLRKDLPATSAELVFLDGLASPTATFTIPKYEAYVTRIENDFNRPRA